MKQHQGKCKMEKRTLRRLPSFPFLTYQEERHDNFLHVICWDPDTRGGETCERGLSAKAKGESDGATKESAE